MTTDRQRVEAIGEAMGRLMAERFNRPMTDGAPPVRPVPPTPTRATPPIEFRLLDLDNLRRRDALMRTASSVSAGFISSPHGMLLSALASFGEVAEVHHACELARWRATYKPGRGV